MISFIGNIFQKADLIGSPININYKGQTSVKTSFNGIVTVLSIIVTFGLSYIFIIPFIQRPIARISYDFVKEINPSQSYLNITEFFLAVNLINPDPKLKKELENLIEIKISNIIEKETNEGRLSSQNTIQQFSYDTSKLSETLNSKYSLSSISNKRLLIGSKVANLEGIYFQGSSVNELFSYISIKLELNLTKMVKAYGSYQAARSYATNNLFANSSFALIYSDLNPKLDNYTTPVVKFLSFFQSDLNFDSLQSADASFVLNKITLDNSFLFEDVQNAQDFLMHQSTDIYTKKVYMVDDYNSTKVDNTNKNDNSSSTLLNGAAAAVTTPRVLLEIRASKIKYVYYYRRYYAKITEVLSNLGGSIIIFYYSLFIIGKNIIDFQMQSQLIKLLYDIDFDDYEEDEESTAAKQKNRIQKRMDIKNIHYAVKNYIKILEKKEGEESKKKPLKNSLDKRGKKREVHNDKDRYLVNYVQEKFEINTEMPAEGKKGNVVGDNNFIRDFIDDNDNNNNNNDNFEKYNLNQNNELNNENDNVTIRTQNRMISNYDNNNNEGKDENKQKMISLIKRKNKERTRLKKKPKSDDVFVFSSTFNIVDCINYFVESAICCKTYFSNKKVNLYHKAKNEMSKNIAINNIVGKFYEIDLLKYFILNKNQINLFKLITMPKITDLEYLNSAEFERIIDNYRNFELKKDSEFKENIVDDFDENRYEDIMRSYRSLLLKDSKTVIDNKILKCIEKNVIEFINYSDSK